MGSIQPVYEIAKSLQIITRDTPLLTKVSLSSNNIHLVETFSMVSDREFHKFRAFAVTFTSQVIAGNNQPAGNTLTMYIDFSNDNVNWSNLTSVTAATNGTRNYYFNASTTNGVDTDTVYLRLRFNPGGVNNETWTFLTNYWLTIDMA